jgi:hypothetical protein
MIAGSSCLTPARSGTSRSGDSFRKRIGYLPEEHGLCRRAYAQCSSRKVRRPMASTGWASRARRRAGQFSPALGAGLCTGRMDRVAAKAAATGIEVTRSVADSFGRPIPRDAVSRPLWRPPSRPLIPAASETPCRARGWIVRRAPTPAKPLHLLRVRVRCRELSPFEVSEAIDP